MSRNQAWALLREGRVDEAEALAGEGLRNASGTRGLLGWILVLLEATCLRGEDDSLQRMGWVWPFRPGSFCVKRLKSLKPGNHSSPRGY